MSQQEHGAKARRTAKDDAVMPERTCLGCRAKGEPAGLVRLTLDASGALQIDLRHKLPGRGAYLHPRAACVATALKRRALPRALPGLVEVPAADSLSERLRSAQERRFLERLSLARRAGQVAAGTEAVREAMRRDAALFVCLAADSEASGVTQVGQNAGRKRIPIGRCLDGSRLAKAVGMDYVTALAVTGEPFASELAALSSSLGEADEAPGGSV